MMVQVTSSNTLRQTQAAKSMRGRVVSYFAIAFFGMQLLGGLLIGSLAERIGTPVTVFVEGLVAVFIALLYIRLVLSNRPAPSCN